MLNKTYSLRPHCVSCWTAYVYILQYDTRSLQYQDTVCCICAAGTPDFPLWWKHGFITKVSFYIYDNGKKIYNNRQNIMNMWTLAHAGLNFFRGLQFVHFCPMLLWPIDKFKCVFFNPHPTTRILTAIFWNTLAQKQGASNCNYTAFHCRLWWGETDKTPVTAFGPWERFENTYHVLIYLMTYPPQAVFWKRMG